MLYVGKYNHLQIIKEVDFGYYLDSEDEKWGEVLLPFNSAPKDCAVNDWLDVFIYFDSDDRIIATSHRPHAVVGEFNLLRVASVEKVGAFMDWGLSKDLLAPFGEQKVRMQPGRSYVVWVFCDEGSGRIVASSRLQNFVNLDIADYEVGQKVELIITKETELGFKAIINSAHWGFLFHSEIYTKLKVGKKLVGYVKNVRPDGKIDLTLTPAGYEKVGRIAEDILAKLRTKGGFLPITATTPSEEIQKQFGISKKNYKKAVGALYKQRLITVEPEGIRLADPA